MLTSDFDFALPEELIAQEPTLRREQSRLLVLRRDSGGIEHRGFNALIEYLGQGDVLALNNSRVIPARLRGLRTKSGGKVEVLLLEENDLNDWWVMLRPGKRVREGTEIRFQDRTGAATEVGAKVVAVNQEGHRRLVFEGTRNVLDSLSQLGEMPTPPYISRAEAGRAPLDWERYQTVYATSSGSVAAPTAGLHFTEPLLKAARERGAQVCFLTLHVGLGTFAPVKSERLESHRMHTERYELGERAATMIREAKRMGRKVFAVGTTTVRVLETIAAKHQGAVRADAGRTNIFIYPPYDFRAVDALVTNFHLPRSTLLMLASAFVSPNSSDGRELLLRAYAEAVRERYRFFSYGDAMLIL